jgi:hypothetical protein
LLTASYPANFDLNQLKVDTLAIKIKCNLALYEEEAKPRPGEPPEAWNDTKTLTEVVTAALSKMRENTQNTYLLNALESSLEAITLKSNPEVVELVKETLLYVDAQ